MPLKEYHTSGSSFDKKKVEYGFISSIMIDDINFQNIGVGVNDLSFIKSTFPDQRKIYGIIGTNILRKAFWQIDYGKQTIKFSNEKTNFPIKPNAFQIPMIPNRSSEWGLNRIELKIGGVIDYFVFDTGSNGSFTANYPFLEHLQKEKIFLDEIIETDNNHIDKRKFKINKLNISPIELINVELSIEKNVSLLIGNSFLENYIITIDWDNNILYLDSI